MYQAFVSNQKVLRLFQSGFCAWFLSFLLCAHHTRVLVYRSAVRDEYSFLHLFHILLCLVPSVSFAHARLHTRAHALSHPLARLLSRSLSRALALACSLDWCCFCYFVRNSLAALLEAIWTQMEIWVLIFWSFCRNRTDNLETNSPALWPTKLVSHRLSALTNYSSLSWLHHRSLCRGAASMFCGEEQRKCQNWV